MPPTRSPAGLSPVCATRSRHCPPLVQGADVVRVERVSVDSHFFADLGADSMVMARFCARVRKRAELPAVSMKDIYRHPTGRGLATALAGPGPALSGSSV